MTRYSRDLVESQRLLTEAAQITAASQREIAVEAAMERLLLALQGPKKKTSASPYLGMLDSTQSA